MGKIKRLGAFLLSMLMLVSSVSIESLADDYNQGQGNDAGGVVTGSGGDFGVNTPTGRIGIRLSLVDNKNPSKVISVEPDGVTTSITDLLYVDRDWFQYFTDGESSMGGPHATALTEDNTYTAVKTQNIKQNNYLNIVYYYKVISCTGIPMPPWAIYENSAYYSKGEDFFNWCTTDDAGNKRVGNGGWDLDGAAGGYDKEGADRADSGSVS